jgi:ABC-type cobalamin/Fe3+-siderophores transport system ATPase subunit
VTFKDFSIDGDSTLSKRCRKKGISKIILPGLDSNLIHNIFHGLKKESYKGSIEVNGVNIKSISQRTLRENISIISSSSVLIGRYVKDCFIGLPKDSRNSLIQKTVKNLNKIFKLNCKLSPKQYIGENGSLLSKYEYEILILALALIQNKKIIILLDLPYLMQKDQDKLIELLKNNDSSVIFFENI